jgi:outer membrane protein W
LDASKTASYVGLGNCQYRLGRKEEALTAYNKALALDPTNAQLTQFVNNLKGSAAVAVPASAPAPALGPAMDNPLKQGADLFAQKRYVESIPLFEQAASKDPGNAQIQYYWAYACAMARDNRGAALHFYKFNMMSPNPGVQTYADRLKAGLPPEDQRWVENQLAGATNIARKSKKPGKNFGFRLVPALLLPSQSSLKNYAKSVTASVTAGQAIDPTMACEVSVPTGFLDVQLQPCYEVSPHLELALSLDFASVGHLKTTVRGTTGEGSAYTDDSDVKFTSFGVGAIGRYFLGEPEKKLRPFVGAGLLFEAAKAKGTYTEGDTSSGDSGSASGLGAELQLGLDYRLGPGVHMGPIVGYRAMKAAKLIKEQNSDVSYDLDLGGPMAGIMLSAFF